MKLSSATHQNIYWVCLLLIAAGLPFWLLLISLAEIALILNWLWEGNIKEKFRQFYNNPAALAIASIFVLHLVGLLWTNEDWSYAFKDLRVKLPVLLFPLVMSSSNPLDKRQFQSVLWLFISAVFLASIASILAYYGIIGAHPGDTREMSLFISHIRFSLLVTLAIFLLIYLFYTTDCSITVRTLQVVMLVWLLIFLFVLKSMSGLVAFTLTLMAILVYFTWKIKNRLLRSFVTGALVFIPLTLGLYLSQLAMEFFEVKEDVSIDRLPKKSANGETYFHYYGDQQRENGYYVNYHIAHEEMEDAWAQRSNKPLSGKDAKGQSLKETLKRFLTSKGLHKDHEGIMALSQEEVKAIESGVANHRYLTTNSLEVRLHKIMWEFDNYAKGMNPQGNSVAQRIEFWKAGWYIFLNHPIVGVGTGDVPTAFDRAYDKIGTLLGEPYRLRGHNQYLTIALTFGALGLFWFIVALLIPFFTNRCSKRYFYIAFFTILASSMINEDTLETQIGATFAMFFMGLFLLAPEECRNSEEP